MTTHASSPSAARAGHSLTLDHLVRRPVAEPPAGTRPPVLVLLHGLGSTEHALFPLRHSVAPEFVVVSARGPLSIAGTPGGPRGRPHGPRAAGWFGAPDTLDEPEGRTPDREAQVAWAVVTRFAREIVQVHAGDPARVLVAGFSQGGMMALAALLTAPDVFAGAAVMSGRLLAEARAAAAPPTRLADRHVLLTHGTDDPRIDVAHARATRDALAALPLALEYHELDARHTITGECRRAFAAWTARVAGVADRPADPEAAARAHRAPPAPPPSGVEEPAAPRPTAPSVRTPSAGSRSA